MIHVRVLGIDIAKQIFHIVGMDDTGTVVLRKRCPRAALLSFIAQMPPVVIGMEACGGAHPWASTRRAFQESAYGKDWHPCREPADRCQVKSQAVSNPSSIERTCWGKAQDRDLNGNLQAGHRGTL
jgi:hypothetical protein